MKTLSKKIALAVAGVTSFGILTPLAFAAEEAQKGADEPLNYYHMALERLGFGSDGVHDLAEIWTPFAGSVLMTVVILLMGLYFKASLAKDGDGVAPSGRFSLRHLIEGLLEFNVGISKDNTHEAWRKFFPFLAAIFLYILVCNLSGLIPGLPPPTESMDTNVAVGIIVFLVYNIAGLKEHGAGYIKHFLGPVAFIAPLFLCIEIVSHASRPLSLGLRLMGNIFGDHTLLGVFTHLSYIVLPALLMFFGLLVAVVQAFVFTLLSGIYISMAISHDH